LHPNVKVMQVDFEKYPDGLAPAIIQDSETQKVLMLGFMNKEALQKTMDLGKITFFSRSRQKLWTKGEESGNFLLLQSIYTDCDKDCLLVMAKPLGPVCHMGTDTCWGEKNRKDDFIYQLEDIIQLRKYALPGESYIADLFSKGINKIAQKLGEEAIELVIEAKDENKELFLNESADLLFHFLVLLNAKGYTIEDVISVLKKRQTNKK
jgi:phosphoribosyl-AMP cyclohydrolase / phosphoribosyl-ATP pyrophosphohydrolase